VKQLELNTHGHKAEAGTKQVNTAATAKLKHKEAALESASRYKAHAYVVS